MSVKALAPRGSSRDGLTRALRRNGIPRDPDLNEPLPKRLLKNKLFWLTIVMILVYATMLVLLYRQVVPDREVPGGTLPGLGTEAIPIAVKYAAITAIPLSLLFLWADRFRPQRFWVWLMTFGWGACVATFISAQVNTWAAGHLSIIGDGDPATAARAAIYVAPFVEEASKATVLFWLAILMRYQWVSRLSGIVLAGLSGAAFAFTENILYYGRVYRYAARTFGEVPPLEALQNLFVMRGVITCFGHPLFTAMTGVGLAIALRSKSKIVRVVAPLAGYCVAVFLHMAFNTTASLLQGSSLLFIYLGVALPLVIGMIIFVVRQLFREGRLIRERLIDYVRLGWLPETDPRQCPGCVPGFGRFGTRCSPGLKHSLRRFGCSGRLPSLPICGMLSPAASSTRPAAFGRSNCWPRSPRSAERRSSSRRDEQPIRRCGVGARGALAAYPPPSYPGPAGLGGNYPAPSAFPAPSGPASGRAGCGFGALGAELLPNTLRSIPPGNRPESRERGWPAGS